MIPEGWSLLKLANVANIKRGAGSQYISYVDKPEDGIRLIRISDFLGDNPKYIERTTAIERFLLHEGDLLIAGTGATAGITFEVPKDLVGLAFSYNAPRIKVKKGTDKSYVLYYLKSGAILKQQHALFTGNAQPFLDTNAIAGFKVGLPPLPEQKKIAEILSTWDKAIETVEKLIANSQQKKKALMQQLLTGKKRFPEFDGEWVDISLKEMGVITSGGTPETNKENYWGGDVLWTTPTDITALKSRFITDTKRKITTQGLDKSSAKLIPKGSLLVCTRATVGKMAISTCNISTNQGFKSLSPKEGFDVEFLYYLLSYNKHQFVRYSCGSTFLELSKRDFEKQRFFVPSVKEQQKIASVLSSADQEIETWQQELEHLKQEKKALMQQLLTGKRRVNLSKQENHHANLL